MRVDEISGYYDRLGRWTRVARALGYRAGRERLSIHRALADPRQPHRASSERLHEVLLQALPAMTVSPRVLDAGCGYGGTMVFLARRLGATCLGVTMSAAQAAVANRAAARMGLETHIRAVVANYDAAPGGPYDLVVAIESLAHSPDPHVSLTALVRCLAPGGVITIVDDMPELAAQPSILLDRFKSGWRCPVLWGGDQYRDALRSLGLTLMIERDLSSEVRPRPLATITLLERLNRALYHAIPVSGWRQVLDSHAGGLALERLYRNGEMHYRMLIARREPAADEP